MLAWFRRYSSTVAITLLASMVAFGGSLVAPHVDDCHDGVCAVVPIPHDESAHRVGGATAAADHPLHCLVCHWARSFRPSETRIVSAPADEPGVRLPVQIVVAAPVAHSAQPPLRSPPPAPVLS